MKEKSIIFNTEMIQAILDNRKTMTRRVIKPQPKYTIEPYSADIRGINTWRERISNKKMECPYGKIGDRLWVRETWQQFFPIDWGKWPDMLDYYHKKCMWNDDCKIFYRANGFEEHPEYGKVNWKPSIFMSRKHSRIDLEITDIGVERVQDICLADITAEGIPKEIYKQGIAFKNLWDSINAKRGYSWESNPYVWCITFKRI